MLALVSRVPRTDVKYVMTVSKYVVLCLKCFDFREPLKGVLSFYWIVAQLGCIRA